LTCRMGPKMSRHEIPELTERGGIQTVCPGTPDDLFVVSASYEDRCRVAAGMLASDFSAKKGIIYYNKENANDKTRAHIHELNGILMERCDTFALIEGSWLHPLDQITCLRKDLPHREPKAHMRATTIDITAFTRESLLTITLLLRTRFPEMRIRVIYVSPKRHGDWLSRGFRCVRNVIGFPGIQEPSRPNLLIVLSGFEPKRTAKIIEEHEPTKVLLGIGCPPVSQHFMQRNIEEQKFILAMQEVERFDFPADSIQSCFECLQQVIRPYSGTHNIVLAPMSTKLSTLAAFLLAEENIGIQITYCVPGEYNMDDYSSGAKLVFIDHLTPVNKDTSS